MVRYSRSPATVVGLLTESAAQDKEQEQTQAGNCQNKQQLAQEGLLLEVHTAICHQLHSHSSGDI